MLSVALIILKTYAHENHIHAQDMHTQNSNLTGNFVIFK